jgi:hypothetical protein
LSDTHPQREAVVDGRILPDAADIGGVFAHAFDRRDVAARLALVDHQHARRLAQDVARLVLVQEILELDVDRLGMADEDRHAHAGRGHLDRLGSRIFFVSATIFHSSLVEPSSRKTSICGITLKAICLELLRRDLLARARTALGLVPQLVHALLAGARHGLIGRHHHPLDPRAVVQRLQRHHHLRGRAVGVRDDVLVLVAIDRVGIHLGHDQRDAGS